MSKTEIFPIPDMSKILPGRLATSLENTGLPLHTRKLPRIEVQPSKREGGTRNPGPRKIYKGPSSEVDVVSVEAKRKGMEQAGHPL